MGRNKIIVSIVCLVVLISCAGVKKNSYVTITGTADENKIGAFIEVKNKFYFLHRMFVWPEGIRGKKVTIKGYFFIKHHPKYNPKDNPYGIVGARLTGKQLLIIDPWWKLEGDEKWKIGKTGYGKPYYELFE